MNPEEISVKEALKTEGIVIYPIKGISMLPMLEEGKDMVSLLRADSETLLKKNDVVLFERSEGTFVLHRITKVSGHGYVITGDNCISGEKVSRKQILAVMNGFYKGTKFIPADDKEYLDYVEKKTADFDTREVIHPVPAEWIYLIRLLFCAISGNEKADIPENAHWSEIYDLSEKHLITSTVFRAVDSTKCPPDLYLRWKKHTQNNLKKTILFDGERKKITGKMAELGIRYVPLKGILISELYPEYGIREFADNDILVDKGKIDEVARFMEEAGYRCEKGKVHYAFSRDPVYSFEIHLSLFGQSRQCYRYFENVIERTQKYQDPGCEYRMTDEDFYLHFLAHFFKHYKEGGGGLRSFADMWLIREYNKRNNIHTDAGKTGVAELCDFEKEMTEITESMYSSPQKLTYGDLCFIMSGGTYGSVENIADREIEKNGKARFMLMKFFPPYSLMKLRYPVLKKVPVLLPFYWIVRLATAVFSRRSRIAAGIAFRKCLGLTKRQ